MLHLKRHFSLLFLGLLLFSVVPASTNTSPPVALMTDTPVELQSTVSQDDFSDPDHLLPVSILVYTEFADPVPSTHNELRNSMNAIDGYFGLDYYSENLADYTKLQSMLPGHDILLIPEQEKASQKNMTDVGTAWKSTLTNFADAGGIVILMAYGTFAEFGVSSHIYNASDLMKIYGSHQITGASVSLSNTTDALARGVSSTFQAPDGSLVFETSENEPIVDNGTLPMIVHKIHGKGHVVLLGFDLFDAEGNCSQILANSIRLHRHIVFDESRSYNHIDGQFSNFTDDLVADGFAVSAMETFSEEYISTCEVLVITYSTITNYSVAEVDVIEQFVENGGGLFVTTELNFYGDTIDPVTERFGFVRNKTHWLNDTDDVVTGGTDFQFALQGENILNHSLTLQVNSIELYGACGFIQVPEDTTSVLVTDTDGTTTFDDFSLPENYLSPADGVTVGGALAYGNGRVVVFGDTSIMLGQDDTNSDGTANYYESGNDDFLQNSMRWLGAAGTPEKTVLFDESHDPNYHVDNVLQTFAEHLTSNGYTVKRMSTFYISLLDMADVLVIIDGTSNHTTPEIEAIKTFVANGGSLLLFGAYGQFGVEVDTVNNEFAMDLNNTGQLIDSDDGVGIGNYITYNESNFQAHPITQGVGQFEDYAATAFNSIGTGTSLIETDTDGTCYWSDTGAADGLSILTASQYQLGRIVSSSGYAFLSDGFDPDGDGQINFYDSDNDLLVTNIFKWLSADRPATIEVLSPNGGDVLTTDDVEITWDATDPNKDPIAFDLFYSSNGGSDWNSITTGLSSDHYNWDITSVPDSTEYLIRIDAKSTSFTSTDQSDAVFTIDHNPPDWIVSPSDITINHTERIGVQYSASDISGVDTWWTNDTTHFTINESGYLSDNMELDVGVYGLKISVNDTLGYTRNIDITITVLEVEPTDTTTTSTTTTSTTTPTTPTTPTTTPPGGIDPILLIIIVVGALALVIVIVVVMRKRG